MVSSTPAPRAGPEHKKEETRHLPMAGLFRFRWLISQRHLFRSETPIDRHARPRPPIHGGHVHLDAGVVLGHGLSRISGSKKRSFRLVM